MGVAQILENLPLPQAVNQIGTSESIERMLEHFKKIYPEFEGQKGDPVTQIFEVVANELAVSKVRINQATQAVLPQYALGTDLDNIASFYKVVRRVGETDDAFRLRIMESLEGRSTAGAYGSYVFRAKNASVHVLSASAENGGGGVVNVWLKVAKTETIDGNEVEVASAKVIQQVIDKLLPDANRPLNDTVNVALADEYPQEVTITIEAPTASSSVVSDVTKSVESYLETVSGIKGELVFSKVIEACHIENVAKVNLIKPVASVPLSANQYFNFSLTVTKTNG